MCPFCPPKFGLKQSNRMGPLQLCGVLHAICPIAGAAKLTGASFDRLNEAIDNAAVGAVLSGAHRQGGGDAL